MDGLLIWKEPPVRSMLGVSPPGADAPVASRGAAVYAPTMNLRFPTRDEIHRAFLRGEDAMVVLFTEVGQQVEDLAR